MPAASAVRKNAPTLYMLRTLYQQDRDRQRADILVSGGGLGGLKWDALHRGGGGRQLGCASRTNTYSALAIFSGMRKATLPCGSTFATSMVSVPTRLPAVSAR